jgi:hypothetical protein
MDFIDTLRELMNFPYAWLIIVIVGVIVLLIVFSAVSSGVRRLNQLAAHTRIISSAHSLNAVVFPVRFLCLLNYLGLSQLANSR